MSQQTEQKKDQLPLAKVEVSVHQVNSIQSWITVTCGHLRWEKAVLGKPTCEQARVMWETERDKFAQTEVKMFVQKENKSHGVGRQPHRKAKRR